MRDDHRQRIFMLRANVNEMNIEPIDLGDEVRYGFQFCLALAPVIVCSPRALEFLHRRELHALRCIVGQFSFGTFGRVDAPAQIGKFRIWKIELIRTNGGLVSCLLAPSLCSTGFGHAVLLLSSFGFRICKCLGDRTWAERDCQTQQRARLEKATARSFFWFFHGVLLPSSSGFLVGVVNVSSVSSALSLLNTLPSVCDGFPR